MRTLVDVCGYGPLHPTCRDGSAPGIQPALKRYVVLGEGTHAMALEKHRMRLIREIQQLLE